MDLFFAGCQGLGLALAAGALFGAPGVRGNPGAALGIAAAVLGAFLYGSSLTPEDHPAWPGWVVGAPAAALAYFTARDISAAAQARAGQGGAGGIAFFVVLFALALAALSVAGPAALAAIPALLAVIYMFATRRRRSSAKHAGLRSLR